MRLVNLLPHMCYFGPKGAMNEDGTHVYTAYPGVPASHSLRLDASDATSDQCWELEGLPVAPSPVLTLNMESLRAVFAAEGVQPGDAILVSMPMGQALAAAGDLPELAGIAVVGPDTDVKKGMAVRDKPTPGSLIAHGFLWYKRA